MIWKWELRKDTDEMLTSVMCWKQENEDNFYSNERGTATSGENN